MTGADPKAAAKRKAVASTEELGNTGFSVLNADRLASSQLPTIISVGVARSGTSMIAGTMANLGIFLGDKSNDVVFEDVAISRAMERGDEAAVRAVIADYDARGTVWGFKRPEIYTRLGKYLPLFRNPRVVAIFRDPVAIAKRNEISMQVPFLSSLEQTIRKTGELFAVVSSLPVPVMIVSYEKALAEPGAFVDAFSAFCGVTLSPDLRERALAGIENGSEKYLANTSVRYNGVFAGIRDGVATGWARRMPRNRVCTVEIVSAGRVIGSGLGDLPREDGNGRKPPRAFRIALNEAPTGGDVEARIAGTTVVLDKSPDFSIA